MMTIDEVIKKCNDHLAGRGYPLGKDILDAIVHHLTEAKGLAVYHTQLGHELEQQVNRHRKFTHTDAVGVAAGGEIGKVTISESREPETFAQLGAHVFNSRSMS